MTIWGAKRGFAALPSHRPQVHLAVLFCQFGVAARWLHESLHAVVYYLLAVGYCFLQLNKNMLEVTRSTKFLSHGILDFVVEIIDKRLLRQDL